MVNIALFRKGEFVIFAMTNGTALIFIGPGITGSSNNISTITVTTFAGGTLVVDVPGSYSTSYTTPDLEAALMKVAIRQASVAFSLVAGP